MKLSANNIVLKLLGLLLLTSAVLKGYELITEPLANTDLWSNRNFLIFTVEFELVMAIWLISGVFKRIAWLVVTACFVLFCFVTFYKAVSGYGSCGCFGKVQVNPWITLVAIDLPAVVVLAVFRPKDLNLRSFANPVELLKPLPSLSHLGSVAVICLIVIAVSTQTLAFNELTTITSTYEVLDPEIWIGKELPILEHIDIADQIKTGNWLLMFYHHDCPDCRKAIVKSEQLARELKANGDLIRIALIQVPPYGHVGIREDTQCFIGKLPDTKEWFVTTPAFVLLEDNLVSKVFQGQLPVIEILIGMLAN